MIDNCGRNGIETQIVPLPNVKAAILVKILEWAEHHKDDPEEDDQNPDPYKMSEWDAELFKVDRGTLIDIIVASEYLDIGKLFTSAAQAMARTISDKTPHEVHRILNG